MTVTAPPGGTAALVEALAAEYAAFYAYGALAAWVPEDRRPYALTALASHRAERDWLRDRIVAAGEAPPPPPAAFDLPPFRSPAEAAGLAAEVELALVPRWSAVAGAVTPSDRPYCTSTAQGAAVRALTWGADAQAFPGTESTPPR
jgi:hypothetical protein